MDYVIMHLGNVTMLLTLWQVLYAVSIKEATWQYHLPCWCHFHPRILASKLHKSKMQLIILICMCPQEWCGQLHKMEKKVCDNGNWTNTSWNVQYQHPGMTWSARTTTDEEFWRRMASEILHVTHKVTKGYIVTSSIIKDILEEYSIQGKDQCVWCWYQVCLTYANSN